MVRWSVFLFAQLLLLLFLDLPLATTVKSETDDELMQQCITVPTRGGTPDPEPCVFPFMLHRNGQEYNSCTTDGDPEGKAWCSVEVGSDGLHEAGKGRWGHCNCTKIVKKRKESENKGKAEALEHDIYTLFLLFV